MTTRATISITDRFGKTCYYFIRYDGYPEAVWFLCGRIKKNLDKGIIADECVPLLDVKESSIKITGVHLNSICIEYQYNLSYKDGLTAWERNTGAYKFIFHMPYEDIAPSIEKLLKTVNVNCH